MYRLVVHQTSGGAVIAERIVRAEGFVARLLGLLGRAGLGDSEGLWLENCRSVHMFFMRFPVDLIFYADNFKVLHVERTLKPWRISSYQPGADGVVEVTAGTIDRFAIAVGDQLDLQIAG